MNQRQIKKRDFNKENDTIFKWIGGVMSLIIFLLFLSSQPWRQRGCFLNENSIYQKEFKGKIIEKFIDYPNHATESIKFDKSTKIGLIRGEYYKIIELGDSIHKVKNSFKLQIHKADTIIEMIYKLPCKEKGHLHH